MQADQAGSALTSADVGANAQNLTGSGSTVTFKAGSSLDSSTASNTQGSTHTKFSFPDPRICRNRFELQHSGNYNGHSC